MAGKQKILIVDDDENIAELIELYLTKEIGIEFKSCLYFFAILFYYCMFRLCTGSLSAEILHMAEMIFTAYIIGYVQVYLFGNFDEAEELRLREWIGIIVCTGVYLTVAFFGKWFSGNLYVLLGFGAYLLLTYFCVFLIYRSKRRIDDKKLNEDLKLFQASHKKVSDEGK